MTPGLFALYLGLAASSGIGYRPLGPAADLTVRVPHVELRSSVDLTPKQATGRGWNLRQDVLVGSRWLVGGRYQAWSGGPWTKHSAAVLAGVQIAPQARLVASRTLGSSFRESAASLGVEVTQGRLRASVGLVRFTQAEARWGVVTQVTVRVK